MANLPQEFRDRIDRLERNFAVSTVIFKKYRPIFMAIFRNPAECPVRPPRGRKQRFVVDFKQPILVDERLHSTIVDCSNPKQIWNDLQG